VILDQTANLTDYIGVRGSHGGNHNQIRDWALEALQQLVMEVEAMSQA
jgi:hypothetical protein